MTAAAPSGVVTFLFTDVDTRVAKTSYRRWHGDMTEISDWR
jgi:hypothetical protein